MVKVDIYINCYGSKVAMSVFENCHGSKVAMCVSFSYLYKMPCVSSSLATM